jgi:fatty aldehyde decarbonylase
VPDLPSDWPERTPLEGAGGDLPGPDMHASTEMHRFHLLTYLVSNAVAAETLSVENCAEAVHVLPTTRAKIEMVDAAQVAGEHILVLGSLGRKLGIGVGRTMVEPCWHGIRRHVRAAIAGKDLAACLILQDLIVGSAAITIYDTLASAGDLDPRAATVAGNILGDAFERREAGTWQLRTLLSQDPEGATDSLRWAHHRAMPELLGTITQSCAELCADGACEPTGVDYIGRDIELLKRRSAERYAETLRALFSPSVVRPLLAGLSGYGGGAAPIGHSD